MYAKLNELKMRMHITLYIIILANNVNFIS